MSIRRFRRRWLFGALCNRCRLFPCVCGGINTRRGEHR